jgi:hypothetical protein
MSAQFGKVFDEIDKHVCIDPINARQEPRVLKASHVRMKAARKSDGPTYGSKGSDSARCGVGGAGNHPQQSGFPRPVASQKPNTSARRDDRIDVIGDTFGLAVCTVDFGEIFEPDHIICGRGLNSKQAMQLTISRTKTVR